MANSTRRALLRGGVLLSELPPWSLSICRKWRERKASQQAFFTYSHFNGKRGLLKLKRTEPRKRSPLSKGQSLDFFKPM